MVGNLNNDEDEEGGAGLAKLNGELDSVAGSTGAVEVSLAAADWKRGFEAGKSEVEFGKAPVWLGSERFGDAKEVRESAKGLGFAVEASDVTVGELPPDKPEVN